MPFSTFKRRLKKERECSDASYHTKPGSVINAKYASTHFGDALCRVSKGVLWLESRKEFNFSISFNLDLAASIEVERDCGENDPDWIRVNFNDGSTLCLLLGKISG